jgi:TonB family protein
MTIIINRNGDVQDISLFSGHPMLAPAAIEAVKQWKYRPYLLNGEPVAVETQVQVNFSLSDKPAPEGVAGDIPGGATGGVIGSMPTSPTTDSPRIATPQRVRVSSGVSQGLLIKKVSPQYPEEARTEGVQGVVLLKATIDKEGSISNLELISGHPLLAPAAIEAVKQWKYRPYLLAGQAVVVETQIQVNFTLQR